MMNLCVSKAIEKDTDTVWLDGKCFTVTRLPSTDYSEDLLFKKDKDPFENLRKQAPQQQRRSIERMLSKQKQEALREKLNTGKITAAMRKAHSSELLVTEEEIVAFVRKVNA